MVTAQEVAHQSPIPALILLKAYRFFFLREDRFGRRPALHRLCQGVRRMQLEPRHRESLKHQGLFISLRYLFENIDQRRKHLPVSLRAGHFKEDGVGKTLTLRRRTVPERRYDLSRSVSAIFFQQLVLESFQIDLLSSPNGRTGNKNAKGRHATKRRRREGTSHESEEYSTGFPVPKAKRMAGREI
ncbi:MAG: hypothetical protein J0I10_19335 [Verrucomicrobia bacterium]|nr:hypothetical protein [Verrucomicrobiota bacterium]